MLQVYSDSQGKPYSGITRAQLRNAGQRLDSPSAPSEGTVRRSNEWSTSESSSGVEDRPETGRSQPRERGNQIRLVIVGVNSQISALCLT